MGLAFRRTIRTFGRQSCLASRTAFDPYRDYDSSILCTSEVRLTLKGSGKLILLERPVTETGLHLRRDSRPASKPSEMLKSRHFRSAWIRAISFCSARRTASLPTSRRSGGASRPTMWIIAGRLNWIASFRAEGAQNRAPTGRSNRTRRSACVRFQSVQVHSFFDQIRVANFRGPIRAGTRDLPDVHGITVRSPIGSVIDFSEAGCAIRCIEDRHKPGCQDPIAHRACG
jgi:hypothetical protein